MRAPLPTTDALFAQEVEQKMSNLLAGFGAVQSFLDRTKHRTATQLAAAETSPGTSKIDSNLPGWEDSNFDVMQAHRWGRRPQYGLRAGNSPGCREDYPPGRPRRSGCVTQIRVRATCQRDEFSLCTSKFESDHPSHAVGLADVPKCNFFNEPGCGRLVAR